MNLPDTIFHACVAILAIGAPLCILVALAQSIRHALYRKSPQYRRDMDAMTLRVLEANERGGESGMFQVRSMYHYRTIQD